MCIRDSLTTTLLEVGPGKEMHQQTGRSITLPNSLFVNSAVINESYRQDFVLHAFTLPVKKAPGWHQAEVSVLKIANEVCAPYIEDAKKHFKKLAAKKEFDPPSIEPRVSITIPEPERVNLIVRIPAPFRRKGRIEQEIIHRYLQEEAEGPNTKAAN